MDIEYKRKTIADISLNDFKKIMTTLKFDTTKVDPGTRIPFTWKRTEDTPIDCDEILVEGNDCVMLGKPLIDEINGSFNADTYAKDTIVDAYGDGGKYLHINDFSKSIRYKYSYWETKVTPVEVILYRNGAEFVRERSLNLNSDNMSVIAQWLLYFYKHGYEHMEVGIDFNKFDWHIHLQNLPVWYMDQPAIISYIRRNEYNNDYTPYVEVTPDNKFIQSFGPRNTDIYDVVNGNHDMNDEDYTEAAGDYIDSCSHFIYLHRKDYIDLSRLHGNGYDNDLLKFGNFRFKSK